MTPGQYDLGSVAITTPVTGLVITSGTSSSGLAQPFLDRLAGMASCALDVNFVYGSGGLDAIVAVETSLNQGQTWIEVARFRFQQASAELVQTIRADTEIVAAYAPAALTDNTAKSGIFGDRWRAKLTTTGTFAGNTAVAVKMNAR